MKERRIYYLIIPGEIIQHVEEDVEVHLATLHPQL